jgi:predicted RecA/RadA family phage recombinase
MANNFRHTGKRLPVASASANIASGALVVQEGLFGVALKAAASGGSLWIGAEGVWELPVPVATAKGDPLFAAAMSDTASLTLTKTAHLNFFIGTAVSGRDSAGRAYVVLGPQCPRAEP